MRTATLSQPPHFNIATRDGPHLTLTSDCAAAAHIFVLEEDIVRVLLLADGALASPPSWAIAPGADDIAEPGRNRFDCAGFAAPDYRLDESADQIVIETTRVRLTIARTGLLCRWEQRHKGAWTVFAQDRPTQAYNFGWWDDGTYHYLKRLPGERHYGLGERSGAMDRSGRRLRLTNIDCMGYDAELDDPLYKSIPWVLTTGADGAAHGIFYDTLADPVFDFGHEHSNYHPRYRYMRADSGSLDYYVVAGPDAAAVVGRFTWLTGRPALMPRWSVGYSGSTMSYTDAPNAQERMGEFLERLAEHDIGCSSFHFSSGYTSIGSKRYVFHWNREKFPDPAAFIQSYGDAGVELVPNIKPALLLSHPRYAELTERGYFVCDADGRPVECLFWDELGSYIDFTNPDAAAWWRGQVTEQLLANGIRATWNDNNEYEIWNARARIAGFGEPRAAVPERPIHTLLMMRASRAAQIAYRPDERPYVVTRSGMAGMHRYAQTWSGDNLTTWKTLRYNQKMALGMALSGVSNNGHDVGGFAGPAPGPELLLRWVQAGIVMPRFSIHSWNDDGTVNEAWMYPEVTPAIAGMMALRQALVPLLHDLLWRYHAHFEPVVRPLWLDFPDDARAWADGDSYLLGPDLLVAPAMDAGAQGITCWLPGPARWVDLRDGAVLDGGQDVTLAAPQHGLPPMLAREGSAHLIDVGPGGFAPRAPQPGVLLFPAPGESRVEWAAFDEAGDGWPDMSQPPLWQMVAESDAELIAVTIRWAGAAPAAATSIALVLPLSEGRCVSVNGQTTLATTATVLGQTRKVVDCALSVSG